MTPARVGKAVIGRCAEHAAELTRKVRLIGETSRMGCIREVRSVDYVRDGRAHAAPGAIAPERNRLIFWGDCAHHQVASLARPDWHCVFDVDKEQAAKTRARMFDMVATDRVAVSGFHMPFPSLGYVERRKDGGYRWIAHSYQLKV